MKKIYFTFILCVLVLCPFQAAYSDTPYILVNIDVTGAVETVAMDINNLGKIVGYYQDSIGYIFGFLRQGEVVVPFGYPGAEYTWAMGINDADWIVGEYYDFDLPSPWGNFLHNGSNFVPVYPPCGEGYNYVNDINNTYWMVGNCGNGDVGFVQSGENHALFSFPGADYTFAFGMNDNYVIAGCDYYASYFGTVTSGFYPFEVPGASQTWAYGINNGGQIVGTYNLSGHWYGYVRETDGKVATIHMPNSNGTTVHGINEFRQLVGTYDDSAGAHAFVAVPIVNPLPADLTVSEIVIDPPDPDPGEAVGVHVTVENHGTYDAGGFFLDWYADESAAPAPPPFGNRREYVPGLAAGATYTMSTTWTYSTSGTYQMYAYADTGYGVYESNENNNVLGPVEILVGVSACECDLIPDDTIISRGGTLGLTATVTNNTNSDQTVKFATKVKLPNGKMYPPDGFLFGPIDVVLAPYGSRSGHLSHKIPNTAPLGIYTYYGYVGKAGQGIIHQCEFDFEVVEAPAAVGPEDWETTVDQDFTGTE